LTAALQRINGGRVTVVDVERPTPLAFPLLVDRAREELSSEKLADRVRRMLSPLEQAAERLRFTRGPSRGFRSGVG
jgi:ATP-dependent Lhr-like helicase